jgi:hypothetical protein
MSDIFKEVEEDIRRDYYKRLWDRFGPYVLGAAVLIVAVTAGYRGWEYWRDRQAQATGDRFSTALQLSADGKHDDAIAAFQAIAKDGSGSYPILAQFRIATEKSLAGDKTGAVAAFDTIAADKSVGTDVQTMARLRAALLLADTASLGDLEARIGDLASTGNIWRGSAREVLGLAAWRTGDFAAARKYFEDIVNDQESANDLRQRSQLMLTLIRARLGEAAPATADTTAAPAADSTTTAPATDSTTPPPTTDGAAAPATDTTTPPATPPAQ